MKTINFNPILHCSKAIQGKVYTHSVLCDGRVVCSFENLEDATTFKNKLQNIFSEYKYSVQKI